MAVIFGVLVCVCALLVILLGIAAAHNGPHSGTSPANRCINILRQIVAAKNEWALENGKTNGTVVTEEDLKPYIKLNAKREFPKCPSGGKYILGRIGELPTCSIGTNSVQPHVLP